MIYEWRIITLVSIYKKKGYTKVPLMDRIDRDERAKVD